MPSDSMRPHRRKRDPRRISQRLDMILRQAPRRRPFGRLCCAGTSPGRCDRLHRAALEPVCPDVFAQRSRDRTWGAIRRTDPDVARRRLSVLLWSVVGKDSDRPPARARRLQSCATTNTTIFRPHARATPMWLSTFGCRRPGRRPRSHIGAHGTLEWLPGKSVALSRNCWPEALIGDTAGDLSLHRERPGRGRAGQAPDRSHYARAYPAPAARRGRHARRVWSRLEALLDEFSNADGLDPKRRDRLQGDIRSERRRPWASRTIWASSAPSCSCRGDHAH